jgi:uncharacterized protein YdaU (DUF1376 family)
MNKTMPWFKFYKADAQTALSTMTGIERGIWVSLLVRCSVIGYIEPDYKKLRVSCGVSAKYIPDIKRVLDDYFVMQEGVYVHPFVEAGIPTLKANNEVGKPAIGENPLKSMGVIHREEEKREDKTREEKIRQEETIEDNITTDKLHVLRSVIAAKAANGCYD